MQFIKKTRTSRFNLLSLLTKISLVVIICFGIIFLLNKIDFPAPIKKIEKIIPNENFKIIK